MDEITKSKVTFKDIEDHSFLERKKSLLARSSFVFERLCDWNLI